MKLAANLSMLYPGLALAERMAAAARDGFGGAEILFPYDIDPTVLAALLRSHRLELVLINTPLGPNGERGLAAIPGAEAAFRDAFARALAVARATSCRIIHVMAGTPGAGGSRAACLSTLVANLRWAAAPAADAGVVLTLEALNRHDAPGYFYAEPRQAVEAIEQVGHEAVRLQFDLYHTVREGLDPLSTLQSVRKYVHHVQIAGAPRRDEPDLGDPKLMAALEALVQSGYRGWIGCEYTPRGDTSAGLAWTRLLPGARVDRPTSEEARR